MNGVPEKLERPRLTHASVEDMALQNDERPLADGLKAQSGTAARLSLTINEYNLLPADAVAERDELLRQIESAIDPLHKVGLLGLFSPKEWIGDDSNPGRAAFGHLCHEWLHRSNEAIRRRAHSVCAS